MAGSRTTVHAGAPAVPSTRAWRAAVTVVFGLGGLTISTWGPRLAELRADLGLGDAALGLVLAGATVGAIGGLGASSVVLSTLGARRGLGALLCLIAAGVATIGLGAGVGSSTPVAVVGFVAVGFGIGGLDVVANVEGAAVERAVGRTLMPSMHAGWSAGAVAGSGIGAAGAAVHLPLAVQFTGEAVLVLAVTAVVVRAIPARDEPVAAPVARPSRRARLRSWSRGWADGRLLLIGLVMLGVELGEGSANSWLTLAVRDGHHRTDAVAALFFVAFNVGETLTRVLGGPVVDRLGRVTTIRVTTALGAVGLLAFIAGGSAGVVLAGTLLWSVGVSMGFPLGMTAAADSGPDPAARVSVVASIGYLATLGGPPVVGFLSEQVGLLRALWLVVVLLALGFAAAGSLAPRPVRFPEPTAAG